MAGTESADDPGLREGRANPPAAPLPAGDGCFGCATLVGQRTTRIRSRQWVPTLHGTSYTVWAWQDGMHPPRITSRTAKSLVSIHDWLPKILDADSLSAGWTLPRCGRDHLHPAISKWLRQDAAPVRLTYGRVKPTPGVGDSPLAAKYSYRAFITCPGLGLLELEADHGPVHPDREFQARPQAGVGLNLSPRLTRFSRQRLLAGRPDDGLLTVPGHPTDTDSRVLGKRISVHQDLGVAVGSAVRRLTIHRILWQGQQPVLHIAAGGLSAGLGVAASLHSRA